ncbi:hypothetical protein M501DRAFT_942061, partial [Patellaria atrata CBS 101060]
FKMKTALIALLGLAGTAFAGEMGVLMQMKTALRQSERAAGVFARGKYRSKNKVPCRNGKAGEYSCGNVDLYSFLTHEQMGSTTREGNDIWGWAYRGREFGAVGQTDGTAFVEVNSDGSLTYIGRLPTQTEPSIWRDVKVINGYLYVGSEAAGHGLQIFDMRKLLAVRPNPRRSFQPKTFSIETDLTAWFQGFGSSHNIVANEATNMIYAVGTSETLPCAGGLFMVDVRNPARPTSPGCASEDGYVHDAQCVIYRGPDFKYRGKEICFNYNEDTLTIVDVTNKAAPKQISRTPYVGASYTHQGWLVSDSHDFLLLDDELDELRGNGTAANGHTTTYIFDIKNLAAPKHSGTFQSPVKSIDHNQYVINGLSYQSNYGSGLRIKDVRSIPRFPDGSKVTEVGFFDVHPEDDAEGGVVEFFGSWSVYPYFRSGYILLNSIERGVYSLKYTGRR